MVKYTQQKADEALEGYTVPWRLQLPDSIVENIISTFNFQLQCSLKCHTYSLPKCFHFYISIVPYREANGGGRLTPNCPTTWSQVSCESDEKCVSAVERCGSGDGCDVIPAHIPSSSKAPPTTTSVDWHSDVLLLRWWLSALFNWLIFPEITPS